MARIYIFVFEPKNLDKFSPIYYVGIYFQTDKFSVINDILREQPNVSFLDFKLFIEQIRRVINQISDAIALVLWLTLAAGCLGAGSCPSVVTTPPNVVLRAAS